MFDIYTRVSDEGGRSGPTFRSPEEQEAAARAWIQRSGDEVGEVVYEGNVSGALAADDRRLGELIRRVESGESDGIVVLYEDRFARDVIEGGRALQRIVDAGGRLIATATGFDSENLNPQSEMVFNFMLAVAQAQRKRNRQAYIDGKESAARRGVYCARAPFGYDRDDAGRLIPNEDAATVREIYRLRAEGIGFSELTRRFNLPTRGTPRNIVYSRVYLGEQRVPVAGRRGEPRVITNGHHPLVTEQEWQAANAVRGRAPIRRGLAELVHLKNVAVCGVCGRYLSVNAYGRDRNRLTYVCCRKGCGKVAIAANTLEPLVFERVSQAVASNEPHVVAVLNDDDRYDRALGEVEQAQQILAAYRDDVRIQATLGLEDFAAGLAARREALELARRQLRETPRPERFNVDVRPFDSDNLSAEYVAHQAALTRRVVQEVRVFPRTAENRVTLRWRGSDEQLPVPVTAEARAA